MKRFNEPVVEIVLFGEDDIIITSPPIIDLDGDGDTES